MARRVAWTETAWRDLDRVLDCISEDSPGYAATFERWVRDRARSLEELAERGRVVGELDDPRVRELLVSTFRLVYETDQGTVHILGLIQGARDVLAFMPRGPREGQSQSGR